MATLDWQLDAEIGVDLNREADAFERGNAAHLNASQQRRLGAADADAGGAWYGVLELSGLHSDEDRAAGAVDPDSGGVQVFVAPGLQYAARRWIADAAVRIPVATETNGMGPEPDTAFFASFRVNY